MTSRTVRVIHQACSAREGKAAHQNRIGWSSDWLHFSLIFHQNPLITFRDTLLTKNYSIGLHIDIDERALR